MRYTIYEAFQSKIYYNVFLLGFVLFLLSFVASELTYGVPSRIAIDVGLGVSALAAVGIALFLGSNLIAKEIDNRTIYMMLSRPLSRACFFSGKIFGLITVLLINTFILYIVSITMFFFLGGEFSSLIVWCFLFSFFEACLVLLVIVLCSLLCNQILAIIVSMGIYVAGYSLDGILELSAVRGNEVLGGFLKIIQNLIPNFSRINIKDFIIYKKELPTEFLLGNIVYGIIFIVLLFGLNIFVFNRKSLD